jgi:hypothetical protein
MSKIKKPVYYRATATKGIKKVMEFCLDACQLDMFTRQFTGGGYTVVSKRRRNPKVID